MCIYNIDTNIFNEERAYALELSHFVFLNEKRRIISVSKELKGRIQAFLLPDLNYVWRVIGDLKQMTA